MDEPAPERTQIIRLAALVGAAVVLAVFLIWSLSGTAHAPLDPGQRMSEWQLASRAQRRATVDQLVEQLRAGGLIGPETQASLKSEIAVRGLCDSLLSELNAAADRHRHDYVSPNQTIERTAERIVQAKGWDK